MFSYINERRKRLLNYLNGFVPLKLSLGTTENALSQAIVPITIIPSHEPIAGASASLTTEVNQEREFDVASLINNASSSPLVRTISIQSARNQNTTFTPPVSKLSNLPKRTSAAMRSPETGAGITEVEQTTPQSTSTAFVTTPITSESYESLTQPYICDVSSKILRQLDRSAAVRQQNRAHLERRLARVQQVIQQLRGRQQQDLQALRTNPRNPLPKSRTEWSFFLARGTLPLKKTPTSKQGGRTKSPRATPKARDRSRRRRRKAIGDRRARRSAHSRRTRQRIVKPTPRPKHPRLQAIINKLTPSMTRSRVRGASKVNLNWRKSPRIKIADTRTSALRKLEQSVTYCGRPVRPRSLPAEPSPPKPLKDTYYAVKIPVQQTRASARRIQNAADKRKSLTTQKPLATTSRSKPPFDADVAIVRYR